MRTPRTQNYGGGRGGGVCTCVCVRVCASTCVYVCACMCADSRGRSILACRTRGHSGLQKEEGPKSPVYDSGLEGRRKMREGLRCTTGRVSTRVTLRLYVYGCETRRLSVPPSVGGPPRPLRVAVGLVSRPRPSDREAPQGPLLRKMTLVRRGPGTLGPTLLRPGNSPPTGMSIFSPWSTGESPSRTVILSTRSHPRGDSSGGWGDGE